MPKRFSRRNSIAAAGVLALLGGSVIGGLLLSSGTSNASGSPPPAALARAQAAFDALPPALAHDMGNIKLDLTASRRVTSGLYLIPSVDGKLVCFTGIATTGAQVGGCNASGDFFHGSPFVYGVSEFGPPDSPTKFEVLGVAQSSVNAIDVVLGGTHHRVPVTADGGFEFAPTADELSVGQPDAIAALDSSGRILESEVIKK